MLELHVASVDASNGNIPVSWCVSKEIIDALAAKEDKDPCIVICLVPKKYTGDDEDMNREYRKVVRLKDLMTYIELPSAGENKMFAKVVPGPFKDAKSRYLDRYGGDYSRKLLAFNKNEYHEVDEVFNAAPVTLEVPNAIFAKEPSDWEKAWIGWMSDKTPINQCEFRRQRLWAYTGQPIIFLASYLLQIVFSIAALLLGTRGFSWEPLLHPLSYDMGDKTVNLLSKGTIFINPDGETPFQKFKYLPFMPAVMIAVLAFIFGGHTVHMGALILVGLMLLLGSAGFGAFYLIDRKMEREEAAPPWYLDEHEQEFLVCNGQTKPLAVGELPSRHKTLRIRFEAFKAQVCRPFSQ